MSSSLPYRLSEPLPTAALARTRGLLRSHGRPELSAPRAQPDMVTTADQLAHAIAHLPRAQHMVSRNPAVKAALLAALDGQGIAYRVVADDYRLLLDVRLRPEPAALRPLPDGAHLSLGATAPFGDEDTEDEDTEDEDDSTEAELDAMVAVLGPLTMGVAWESPPRGLPGAKPCGVRLCRNGEWTSRRLQRLPLPRHPQCEPRPRGPVAAGQRAAPR
ncbi:hypothetical protein ACIQGZ_20190 [Streptomyces sp. NPDC092296]|uniref:hypothetical protein n=1 Tax=Streptomyces sp. NPDC092296 TaxID=3366012 RepID=UPI0038153690